MRVKRPIEVLRGAVSAVRDQFSAVANQSERTLLLGTVLLVSAVSAVVGYVLTQYYSVDVLSSLVSTPDDCIINWGPHIGRHCFSDYQLPVSWGMRPNPWEPYPLFLPPDYQPAHNNYPAAAMVPQMIFGLLGKWLHAPQLGLLGYLLALTIAVLTPAVWAARGARGLERMVVFVVCGAAAIPAWMVLDRANSVALLAPVGLVFLVALCRQRWGLVAIMVVLATLVKPQFAVLAVALFAARQWRMGGVAVAGAVTSSLAAYLLWPRDFPATITQSIHSMLNYRFSSVGYWDAERILRQSAPLDSRWHQGPTKRLGQDTGRLSRWSAIAGGICRAGRHRRRRAGSRAAHPPCPDGHHAAGQLPRSFPLWSFTTTWCSFCRSLRSLSETPTGRLVQGFSTSLRPTGAAVVRSASA